MPDNKNNTRDSNIELLRIVLMVMIIMHHIIVHGGGLQLLARNTFVIDNYTGFKLFFNSFLVISVNCFVFISGYYGIKFRIKTLVNILIQVCFYSVVILILGHFFYGDKIGIKTIITSFLGVSTGKWWFITAYVFLYSTSTFLNMAIDNLTRNQLLFMVVVLIYMVNISGFLFEPLELGVNSGYSFINMVNIYVLARFISKYCKTLPYEKFALPLYIIFSLIIYGLSYKFIQNHQKLAWKMFVYNNPIILMSSVILFFIFKHINIKSKFINYFATGVLGVYLIHTSRLGDANFQMFYNWGKNENPAIQAFLTLLIAIAVFVICWMIEKLRSLLCEPIIEYVFLKKLDLAEKFQKYFI